MQPFEQENGTAHKNCRQYTKKELKFFATPKRCRECFYTPFSNVRQKQKVLVFIPKKMWIYYSFAYKEDIVDKFRSFWYSVLVRAHIELHLEAGSYAMFE